MLDVYSWWIVGMLKMTYLCKMKGIFIWLWLALVQEYCSPTEVVFF
jgi:hypothetical protein